MKILVEFENACLNA